MVNPTFPHFDPSRDYFLLLIGLLNQPGPSRAGTEKAATGFVPEQSRN
jgi:hypothetical protein